MYAPKDNRCDGKPGFVRVADEVGGIVPLKTMRRHAIDRMDEQESIELSCFCEERLELNLIQIGAVHMRSDLCAQRSGCNRVFKNARGASLILHGQVSQPPDPLRRETRETRHT